jgi:hypothetical protein
MKNIRSVVIALGVIPLLSITQPRYYLSVGFKYGFSFGTFSQPIAGFEVSVSRWPETGRFFTGLCASYELSENVKVAHFGVELGNGIAAGSIGPSLILNAEESHIGAATTLWTGLGILPYLRQTWLPGYQNDFSEIGVFLKAPRLISGPKLSI